MKVLIAEDDPFTRQALGEILRSEGWDPITAENGLKAWELFLQGGFDLACLDIMMPGLSGYDLCKRIREKDKRLPILFISAKSEEFDKVLGLELGADDFIVKPFGAREVIARIRAVLRRSSHSPESTLDESSGSPTFHFGPWTVDPQGLRAKNDSQVIDLSPRELKILELLYRNPGKALSRVSLFEHCWGWEQAPQSRTLDQHVAVLRKKLEVHPSEPRHICTVQGVGYRYEP